MTPAETNKHRFENLEIYWKLRSVWLLRLLAFWWWETVGTIHQTHDVFLGNASLYVHLHECSIVVTVWLIKVSIWWNYLHDLIICLILYNAEEGHLNSFTRFSYLHRYITSVGTVSQGCGTAQPEGCPFPWLFPKVTKPQMHCRSLPVRHILPVFSLVSSIHFVGGKQRYQSNIFG